MSIKRLNKISDYWSTKMCLVNRDFCSVMSRNDFTGIRRCVRLYPSYDNHVATRDPLWYSKVLMNASFRSAATIAVPTGIQNLDEISVRCSARTAAKTYMPNKPIQYGIIFYAIVGNSFRYIHSLYDKNSGNKTAISPAYSYCLLFRSLRGVYARKIDEKLVRKDTA